MVRIARSLDEIKEDFKDLQFLVDGQGETAGSLLKTERLFNCTLDSIAVALFVNIGRRQCYLKGRGPGGTVDHDVEIGKSTRKTKQAFREC